MALSDSYLFDAGWLFFAALTVVVSLVGVAAFGRDLLPWRVQPDTAKARHPQQPVGPGKSGPL